MSDVTAAALGNTILEVSFKVTNVGSGAGAPTCRASYAGGKSQLIDLKAYGSLFPSTVIQPGVVDFVSKAASS